MKLKSPESSVDLDCPPPINAVEVMVTVTPDRGVPPSSTTVPISLPVVLCAAAGEATRTRMTARGAISVLRVMASPPRP